MTPHTRNAALLAAAAPCLLAALLAALPAAASDAARDAALNGRPAASGGTYGSTYGDAHGGSHAAHRPVDKTYPVQPPPGRLAQGEPVQRALPGASAPWRR
ncbi:hypothetical protein [Kitasatospora cineracea]|uniref:Uncharacterized protein n=1 Tax=Kitasatospora cineracea TaxID=88074 RepID=A0A8G1UAU8_9ACTN|nr:hypothetical protein [Kitasatospora cineracea]ROR35228.1 hypothetical protein EDD39_6885 [Kitasatospora cineracea]